MASKKSAKNKGKPQQRKESIPAAKEDEILEIEEEILTVAPDKNTAERRERDKGKKKESGAFVSWIRKADPIAMTCFTVFILAFVVVTASYVNTMYIADPPAQHVIVNGDSVEVEYTGSYFAYYDRDGAVIFDTNVQSVNDGSNYMKSPGYTNKTEFELLDFTIGSEDMLEMFEDALIGHSVGETVRVTIPAADGYGTQSSTPFANNVVSVTYAISGTLSLSEFNDLFDTEYTSSMKTEVIPADKTPFGFEVQATYDSGTGNVNFQYIDPKAVTEAQTSKLDSNVTYTISDVTGTQFTVNYTCNEEADHMFEILGADYETDYVYKEDGNWVYRDDDGSSNAEQKGMTLYFVIKIVSVNA